MATTPEQSSPSNLQPGTRNPQTAPGELFTTPQTLQSGNQSTLLEDKRATISVPSNPAPATTPAAASPATGGNTFLMVVLAMAAFTAAVWFWRRWRQPVAAPAPPLKTMASPEPAAIISQDEQESEIVLIPAYNPPKPKKPAPKRSKSRRKKRARR